mmetsp:Transcript_28977/g.86509  ORF Transcript_28977/g.86509 Transcript_28977/m.86509 type:complete len:731 (+) Transcript_28977:258-2450(+)
MAPRVAFTEGVAPVEVDPHASLEVVLDEKNLAWVEAQNADVEEKLGDVKGGTTYGRILAALDSKDKIPGAYAIGDKLYNFWQDDEHVQGIWRSTTLESYKAGAPAWETVLDIDALPPPTTGTAKTWVWHGSTLLDDGNFDRCLIALSPGGSDADTSKEFDLSTGKFLEGGFELLEPAKTQADYRSRDELLVGGDPSFGDCLTDSGYPRTVRSWKRGTPLADAKEVFAGEKTDISVSQYAYRDRGVAHEFRCRSLTFYTSKYWHRTPADLEGATADEDATPFAEVPVPEDARVSTFGDAALVTLRSDWTVDGKTFAQGSLLSLPFAKLMARDLRDAQVLFEPTAARSLEASTATKNFLILKVLEDVRATLTVYERVGDAWKLLEGAGAVAVGEDVSIQALNRFSDADDRVWIWRDGYLQVDALDYAEAGAMEKATTVKTKEPLFDAAGLTVEQHFATSKDGTKVPYFVQRRADCPLDGSTPTLLDAYGGFEISMTPHYSAGVGIGWLERGGCKVIANVRGGGEYGPSWHQAALKEKRHKAYEDVEAVAADVIARGITSKEKLAVIGGSNGGLMVGNMIVRPVASKLFGAAVCQVPLLDMKRYSHLLAGASWMAEYGDPDTDEWAFLRKHSPYHILRHDRLGLPEDGGPAGEPDADWTCPKVLFTTSTRDDRVHPGHARKMVKALMDAPAGKVPELLYYENTEGGHGGAADNKQRAYMWALTYEFLAKALGL